MQHFLIAFHILLFVVGIRQQKSDIEHVRPVPIHVVDFTYRLLFHMFILKGFNP